MHSSWSLLFNDPDFWALLSKDHFVMLSSVCRQFRSDIPQRVAIMALFRDKPIKKVAVFRLLPLSVNDVLGLRSPVDFLTALAIAEKKCGGFDRCLAILREKGLQCWIQDGERRMKKRMVFEAELGRLGVTDLPTTDPLYRAAVITQQRVMESVAVWGYATTDAELLAWQIFNPYTAETDLARRLVTSRTTFRTIEYDAVLACLKDAMGYWYKGVNADVRTALGAIRAARAKRASGCTIVLLSHQKLLVGRVTIRPWPRPPPSLVSAVD